MRWEAKITAMIGRNVKFVLGSGVVRGAGFEDVGFEARGRVKGECHRRKEAEQLSEEKEDVHDCWYLGFSG